MYTTLAESRRVTSGTTTRVTLQGSAKPNLTNTGRSKFEKELQVHISIFIYLQSSASENPIKVGLAGLEIIQNKQTDIQSKL